MSNYAYVAVDPRGLEMRGTLDVSDQNEAVRRIKEMGLFPTKVLAERPVGTLVRHRAGGRNPAGRRSALLPWLRGRVKPSAVAIFTRQLATLTEAGMPLLRGLRVLEEQEENRRLKRVIGELADSIESGSSLGGAVAGHPRVFNRLYVSMVKAGELGGALEITLNRVAEFLEKAQKIKSRIKAAMFYPCAVLVVAAGILAVLMAFVVPRFRAVFVGLLDGRPLPGFTQFVFHLSELITQHFLLLAGGMAGAGILGTVLIKTALGRHVLDWLKLRTPVLGSLFRKAAIARFARTLGTLAGNGVPILQALAIVKETAGNLPMERVIARVHERVKEGDPMAPTLKESRLFPALVAGMVDVGEQTGALPEMLVKVADNYDEEVNNAASALTSLLEPVMIVILAVIVGSIVIAMFLPLVTLMTGMDGPPEGRGNE
jgi:type IV pilus assembly protein PilC